MHAFNKEFLALLYYNTVTYIKNYFNSSIILILFNILS